MGKFSIDETPGDVLQEIALRIRTLRKQAEISQGELAERSGVSLGSIKRFEHTGQISLESLLKLALILNRLNDFSKVLIPEENKENLFSDKTRR